MLKLSSSAPLKGEILIPGDNVDEVAICDAEKGGEANG